MAPLSPPHPTCPTPCSSDTLGKRCLPAPSGRSAHLGLPTATRAHHGARARVLQAFQEGKSLSRQQAETWNPRLIACSVTRNVCDDRLCTAAPFTKANVTLQPLAVVTGSKHKNFFEVDSRGNYNCHPKLVIYVLTQAEIFGRCWLLLHLQASRLFCVCHHPPQVLICCKGRVIPVINKWVWLVVGWFFRLGGNYICFFWCKQPR